MRLQNLRKVYYAAQLDGCGRNLYSQQGITGLAGSDKMADRTDTTDARHQRRHLSKRPSLTKFLKAAHLRHMKMGVLNLSCTIKLERNFGMPLNARDWIDCNTF